MSRGRSDDLFATRFGLRQSVVAESLRCVNDELDVTPFLPLSGPRFRP
jgi:hypothetical protein